MGIFKDLYHRYNKHSSLKKWSSLLYFYHQKSYVLITSCFQNIIHYKIAGYGSAHAIVMELDLRTVTDLLHEVLVWEKQNDQALTAIALKELNVKATNDLTTKP